MDNFADGQTNPNQQHISGVISEVKQGETRLGKNPPHLPWAFFTLTINGTQYKTMAGLDRELPFAVGGTAQFMCENKPWTGKNGKQYDSFEIVKTTFHCDKKGYSEKSAPVQTQAPLQQQQARVSPVANQASNDDRQNLILAQWAIGQASEIVRFNKPTVGDKVSTGDVIAVARDLGLKAKALAVELANAPTMPEDDVPF